MLLGGCFSIPSEAAETELYDAEEYREAIPDSVSQYADIDEIAEGAVTTAQFFDIVSKITGEQIRTVIKAAPGLLLLIMIGAVSTEFSSLSLDTGLKNTASMAVSFITFLYIMDMLVSLYTNVSYKMDELYEYGKTLSSVMGSFMFFGGNYSSVSAILSSMIVLCTFLSFLSRTIFPAVCAVIIVSSVASLSGGASHLNSVSQRLSGLYGTLSTAVISILSLIMGFQNRVAQSTDSVVLKSAKIASAYAIPVVGGVISESVDNISSGFSLIKNSFGFGAVCVILLCIVPSLVSLLIYKLFFTVTSVFCEIAGANETGRMFAGIDSLFNVLLITVVLNALTYIYCLILFTGLEGNI
ncbi:MAG: hypothetical protein HFE78_03850 [Clostridiales bacterium]|nr:hypothetical protein [Clostridiales bacterium]